MYKVGEGWIPQQTFEKNLPQLKKNDNEVA
jgi:hypothetical protein